MTEDINVKSIVVEWLKINNYDGLVSDTSECGCSVDDLMPCGFDCIDTCLPAYKYVHDGEDYYSNVLHDKKVNQPLEDTFKS